MHNLIASSRFIIIASSRINLNDVSGCVYQDFLIDESRWYRANSAREQEAIILGAVRRDYPEAEWEKAHYTEIHNA
ncbi:MAG: hypothetical protein IKM76_06380 [Prevotella sp.]|nr:hypothetical protein [Prevotella sp.]